ncbi:hypothetical protein Cantr_02576 [Candida viswanathii]|uniref:Zn(2)-C6 fungal-type domain-containing protein n=1 Tax=Candida viswanathii TaxID=5486 RepID=A0A367YM93_9ASCO|nr:hypothetical protein Cantr_02576 [Candida viswanathii]
MSHQPPSISRGSSSNIKKERKTRRTHKNSRDGCPNCKAKRIKCSEELPSCHNCIKKNYRCGYLDFPPDKLEMIRQKNSKRLLSTNTTNSTSTTTTTTNDNLRVENQNLPQAPNFNRNFQPQPERYGYQPVIPVSNDSQQHPPLQYNPAQPYYINDQQPILHGDDHMLGSSAPGTSSSSSNFIANLPPSLHSSPNSDSPNHLNQIVSNYIPMSIPNEDQSVTPPDIFQNVPQDKVQYYVEIPSTTDDLKAALYKDTIRRISHVRNDFDLPTFSSDSSYDNQTEYNPAPEQQQQQQQQLQQQMPPPMTQPSTFNNGYQDVDATLGAPVISHADFDVGYESQSSDDFSHTRAVFAEHFGIVIPKSKETEQQNIAPPPHQAKIGDALPNAVRSPVSLRMLQYPKTYLNTSSEEYLRDNRELLEKTLLSPKSIWTKQDDKLIWTSIFSGVIGRPFPNFAFFIDRGLNVILKVCNRSLASVTSDTCFTKETFDVLVKRSYSSYGGLIKNLRESIGLYIESSTILSWLSSWSLFIHNNSTAKVSNLILTGSTSLLRNCLNDYQKISDVHPTIAFIIRAIRVNTFCASAPDYKFDIIEQLYHDVVQYKKFVIYNQGLTTKNNGYILKSFVDLENFLYDLINNRYPRIKQLDGAYKRKNNLPLGGNSIEFISPDDIFSVIVDWLSIVPSHAMSVGKSMTPLKKNYYLFFIAIGVALSSIFPYMRSVFLVDPWNVIFPRTDFDNELYKFTSADVGRADQFEYLSQLSKKLLRIINFFLNRRLLIYSVINQTNVLQPGETYLEKCESIDGYPNVVHLKPAKVKFNEVPLADFSINNIINAYNYPMVDFKSEKYKQFKGAFSTETHDQKARIKELRAKFENTDKETTNGSQLPKDDFDYSIGMFAYDFNIKPLLDEMTSVLTELKPNTIEEIKQELENFENSQKEVGKCV